MRRNDQKLLLVIAFTVAALAVAASGVSFKPVQIPLALLLVLVLPGYALQAAMLPGRGTSSVTHAVLTVGLSLTVSVLGGFVLNLTSVGLRAGSWSVFLGAVTLGASGVALWRGRSSDRPRFEWSEPSFGARQAVLMALATVLVAAAFGIANQGAARPTSSVTELWILPGAPPNTARIGVISEETAVVTYRLQLEAGGRTVREWPEIQLAPGQAWQTETAVPAASSSGGPVTATLYRLDQSNQPYRHVIWWRDGRSG